MCTRGYNMLEIAICDDEILVTGKIERMLENIAQKVKIGRAHV